MLNVVRWSGKAFLKACFRLHASLSSDRIQPNPKELHMPVRSDFDITTVKFGMKPNIDDIDLTCYSKPLDNSETIEHTCTYFLDS